MSFRRSWVIECLWATYSPRVTGCSATGSSVLSKSSKAECPSAHERAPKTATKRVFLVTNVDDPHPGPLSARFKTTARTTLDDLAAAGAQIEPFFIAPFDISKFYSASISFILPNCSYLLNGHPLEHPLDACYERGYGG
jgi:hypothetical protein